MEGEFATARIDSSRKWVMKCQKLSTATDKVSTAIKNYEFAAAENKEIDAISASINKKHKELMR